MKWVTRAEKKRLRRKKHSAWHKHFAWLPRKVDRAEHCGMLVPEHRVWLGLVERRYTDRYGCSMWEYRTMGTN